MNFINYNELPQAVKDVIDKEDYIGYVRVYFRNGRYGSRLFFKGTSSGTIEEITQAEAMGRSRYTEEMQSALQTVCETLFEENNPNGKYELFDFCKKNKFEETEYAFRGFCYMAHSAFEIVVRKDDDYFCRVYFYRRD